MNSENEQLNTEPVEQPQAEAEQPSASETQVISPKKRKISKFWDILLWVLIALLATAVVIRAFVLTEITVNGESMTASYYNDELSAHYDPNLTFHSGNKVRVNKVKSPSRGDVVVFYKNPVDSKFLALFASSDDSASGGKYEKLIKRVVALAGDKLWVEQVGLDVYQLVIQTSDGNVLYEDYYEKEGKKLDKDCFLLYKNAQSGLGILADCTADNPFVVSAGHFFALGDNRVNSSDSRSIDLGEVPLAQLFGVVI